MTRWSRGSDEQDAPTRTEVLISSSDARLPPPRLLVMLVRLSLRPGRITALRGLGGPCEGECGGVTAILYDVVVIVVVVSSRHGSSEVPAVDFPLVHEGRTEGLQTDQAPTSGQRTRCNVTPRNTGHERRTGEGRRDSGRMMSLESDEMIGPMIDIGRGRQRGKGIKGGRYWSSGMTPAENERRDGRSDDDADDDVDAAPDKMTVRCF